MGMKITKPDAVEVMTKATTEYTDEVGQRCILAAMETPSITHVAAECGIPYRTLRYWLESGSNGHPRYEYFAVEFERARAGHENRYMKNVEAIAADDNPRAANARLRANEFLLEKLFPKQYKDQLFVSTMIERKADGFDLSALPTAVLREFMKTLKVIRASNDGADEDEIKKLLAKVKLGGPDGKADRSAD